MVIGKNGANIAYILLLLHLLAVSVLSAVRPNIRFERLTIEDGMSQSSVTSIIQDRRGFIWLGTQDGLNRYDGYEFKIFKPEPGNSSSLSHGFVRDLLLDSQGKIWIGTDAGGVNRYDPVSGTFTRYDHNPDNLKTISHNRALKILEDTSGKIWIITANGYLNRYNPGSEDFTRFHLKNERSGAGLKIYSIIEAGREELWLGTSDGIYEFSTFSGTFKNVMMAGSLVRQLYTSQPGIIWFGVRNEGIARLNRQTDQLKRFPLNAEVFTFMEDQSGQLWIGSRAGGLLRFNSENETLVPVAFSSMVSQEDFQEGVVSFFQDRSGVIWIGLFGDGVLRFDPRAAGFGLLKGGNGAELPTRNVSSIVEDRDGTVWILLSVGGLCHFNLQSGKVKVFGPENICDRFFYLCEDGKNGEYLWAGTDKGIIRYNKRNGKFQVYGTETSGSNRLSDYRVVSIYSDPAGVVWAGTMSGGLNRLDPVTGNIRYFRHNERDESSLSHDFIFFIKPDRMLQGQLWLGTTMGLNQFDVSTERFKRHLYTARGGAFSRFISMSREKNGIIWLGTMGNGLIRYNPVSAETKRYSRQEGLSNDVVYGILNDEQGHLWLSTNDGLFMFDLHSQAFSRYDKSDGLQDNEFNNGSFHKGQSGMLYFGGISGLTYFTPEKVKRNVVPPVAVITGFRTFNKELKLTPPVTSRNHLDLSYEDTVFSLAFSALDYSDPRRNRYKYKMEGFDKEWLDTDWGNRIATYTNLDPGDYHFKVMGTNNHGVWSKEPAAITIIIHPPFWLTWWFKSFLALLAMLGIYWLYHFRLQSIQRQKVRLEHLVNERTADLQEKTVELENINRIVKSVNEELKEANKRAEKERQSAELANRSKSDFLARMSHEIRTPMNSVIGFTDMLMDTKMDEEQVDYVRTIHRSGEALLTLINDILDFSRIESGQLSLENIPFDPEEIAFESCDIIRPRIGEQSLELLCQIGEGVPPRVKGDPGRFRQVLINLLGNAVKFTDIGEIVLTVSVEKETEESVRLICTVRDTGIGIAEDQVDKIFQVFQQADGTITRKFGGSGLGLAICKQISRLMKGDITVESVPGKGSKFHFAAQFTKVPESEIESIKTSEEYEFLEGKRALIVDDNRQNLEILTHSLESVNMKVHSLRSGLEVPDTIRKALLSGKPFDICILDIQMPDITGYEVAGLVRGMEEPLSGMPLLAYSSSTASRSKKYLEFGFDAFLAKPARRRHLLDLVEQLLRKEQIDRSPEAVTPSQHPEVQGPVEETSSVRVLLVEDNPINRKLAGYLLSRAGYRYDIAENGKIAVDMYLSSPVKYRLILMDVQMPVMGGMNAVKAIREAGYIDVPIIAMTAQSMRGDREKCLQAGMNDYISKPIKRDIFLEKLKYWTSKNAGSSL